MFGSLVGMAIGQDKNGGVYETKGSPMPASNLVGFPDDKDFNKEPLYHEVRESVLRCVSNSWIELSHVIGRAHAISARAGALVAL